MKGFLQHQMRAVRHTGRALKGFIPKETRTHSRQALREWLLSFEVLTASAIESLDEGATGSPDAPPVPRADAPVGKVKVEVQ
jgi:hypothetical protein